MIDRDRDPTIDNATLHSWCKRKLEDGRDRRRPQEAQWWENLSTFVGDLWAEFDVTLNKLVETPRQDHKVRLPINLAQPVVRTEYAKILKNRPIIDVLARSNERADLNAAEVADKLLNNFCERQFHLPKVRRRCLQWVLVCGLAGIFTDYDETLLGETEVMVDDEGNAILDPEAIEAMKAEYENEEDAPTQVIPHGDLVIKPVSPFQLVWDASQLDLEDASWMIVSDVYDIDKVWRRWGVEVEASSKAHPGVMERRMLSRFDLSGLVEWTPGKSQNLVEVHRMFIKPGHRYFEHGAEVVFTDDDILDSTNYPFSHGELPVSVMGHVAMPGSQHSMSILQQVKPVVLELSKTESQMIENRNLMSNPPWIEFRSNRISGEIQNKPGMRLKVDYMPNIPEPHPIEMPDLPAYVKDLPTILKEHILEISGQGETSQGRVPAGARSGVAIAYLQEEDDTKLGPTVQEFEEMITRTAGHILWTMAQKYTIPRTVQIYRRHSEPEVFDFVGTMLAGVEGVQVQAGSALPRSKAAKQQFILDLWDRKLEQDPRKVREMLELSGGDPDEWEVDINQAERELMKLKQGTPVPVLEWYNHAAHHYVTRRFMKSADFEELDSGVQQLIMAHDEKHSEFEQAQQQQMMVQQVLMGAMPDGSAAQEPPPGGNGANAVPQPPFVNETPMNGTAPMNVQDMQPQ